MPQFLRLNAGQNREAASGRGRGSGRPTPGSGGRLLDAIMGGMTDRELRRRAEALGVSASYLDWRKRRVEASDETLAAIVDALGGQSAVDALATGTQREAEPPPGAGVGAGPGAVARLAAESPPGAGARLDAGGPLVPQTRSWGFTVQLYSLRSRPSWGHGDLRDLADLAAWSGRRPRGRLRAGQPAARGRAAAAGQRVPVPADDQEIHQPALPADRGHPRVPAARRGERGPHRRPGRAAAGPQQPPPT